ncbi:MAG: methionyl-tRNA formyltransferase [Spirochaetes bacterium]|nr:methionyl-tRNA formyltransferase [Spirochaetota bacterium]
MRILFAGTPGIAVPSLRETARAHEVCTVLTGPDQPAGRGRAAAPSEVKQAALALGLRVLEADRLDAGVRDAVRALAPELLVVVAFGRIFRQSFLDLFPRGGVNVHPSLLPRHRGPSPIASAILCGDRETGVTVQRIALEVDSGDIYAQRRISLDGTETTGSLTSVFAEVGANLLAEVLASIAVGTAAPVPQAGEVTCCKLTAKEDGTVDWSEPAAVIERKVRAYDPWPRASTTWEGRPLLLLHTRLPVGTVVPAPGAVPGTVLGPSADGLLVQAGDGPLALVRLQPAFGRPMEWRAFLNGHPGIAGARLGGSS